MPQWDEFFGLGVCVKFILASDKTAEASNPKGTKLAEHSAILHVQEQRTHLAVLYLLRFTDTDALKTNDSGYGCPSSRTSIHRTRRNRVSSESNSLSIGCRGERQGILGRIKKLADSEDDMFNLLFVVKIYLEYLNIAAPVGGCTHRFPVIEAL
jgi:hypothetical protein